MTFEVSQPILNSPYEEPLEHWYIRTGETPERVQGRRPAMVFQPRDQREAWDISDGILNPLPNYERGYEMRLVNLVRERVARWREAGYPGVTRTTDELLRYWRRDGRDKRLFYAQLEAVETIVFLTESRLDFRQGIAIPRDEIGPQKEEAGHQSFLRYACKMATGAGKTTVMGMLTAWSILNKVNARGDRRFSDAVLVVCPNVTIRDRLRELEPSGGEASLYRTRDLVPPHFMPLLARGRVLVTNWHVFEPQSMGESGGVSARVVRAGVPLDITETVHIGEKTTVARGNRYLTLEDYVAQVAAEKLFVKSEQTDESGKLRSALVYTRRWVESDSALLERVLGREIGKKENILVFNDEAHHAYRIHPDEPEDDAEALLGDAEDDEELVREATVWVDGLDRVHMHRGINVCIDLSATPYFLARVGRETAKPFPWTVSDFGLVDAIESGLVKIPQLAVSDTTGAERAKYFNIWKWVTDQLTAAERGGKRNNPKPEAVLKHAAHPIAMLAGQWREEFLRWRNLGDEKRPPVFILVCKDTRIARVIYDYVSGERPSVESGTLDVEELRNTPDDTRTIRVDSKVVAETDTGGAKADESRWMRFTLDTVGRLSWPTDSQSRPLFPSGFEELAGKLGRPLTPPGRDIRCIVSVGMLTEGWDANTVTHIIGIRPFMSQLLCEQVVGRGLRRASYEVDENGLFTEEVAQVFGVPFEVIPFKATQGAPPPKPKRFHVHALPARIEHEIRFPRVEGYTQAVRNRITVDWPSVARLRLEPGRIPTIVDTRGFSVDATGRPATGGPGRAREVTLEAYRAVRRVQQVIFDLARELTTSYVTNRESTVPAHALFPQVLAIVEYFVRNKVEVPPHSDLRDIALPPYRGEVIERLTTAIHPDTAAGEAAEIPRYAAGEPGSTVGVDFWTSKEVREVSRSHVNFVVADTRAWEQQTAFYIDRHPNVLSFVKNAGLGFTIPYLHNGQGHDYVPDFLVMFDDRPGYTLILETKGFDPLEEIKQQAAERWVAAVNADGKFGDWAYALAKSVSDVSYILQERGSVSAARA